MSAVDAQVREDAALICAIAASTRISALEALRWVADDDDPVAAGTPAYDLAVAAFGRAVKAWRESYRRAGLYQRELAEMLEIRVSSLAAIEAGRASPSEKTMVGLVAMGFAPPQEPTGRHA